MAIVALRVLVVASALVVCAAIAPWATGDATATQTDRRSDRRELPVPDLPGYVTLKADFHLHSVFSDGEVWPTVHIREAWRDGLDVVSMTEHLEYRPHRADLAGDALRAFAVGRSLAGQLGMLLIPGVEITRPVPGVRSEWPVGSAHFNVLFPTDVQAFDTPDLTEALRRARAQGAFVFWNHPGFMDKPAEWFPHVGALFDAGLFSGIEVVNGDRFYPEALDWSAARKLTPLANSDAHQPMPAHLTSARRPITLVFAKSRTPDGIKEALESRRTLAWLDRQLYGAPELLEGLFKASVTAAPVEATPGSDADLTLTNASAIAFDLSQLRTPSWLSMPPLSIPPAATSTVRVTIAPTAPAGSARVDVRGLVTTLQIAGKRSLETALPLTISVRPRR